MQGMVNYLVYGYWQLPIEYLQDSNGWCSFNKTDNQSKVRDLAHVKASYASAN